MKLQLVKGSQSVILTVFILDSSSTTGAGLGGLTEALGIVGGYVRQNGTGVALAVDENVTTEGTYQAPSAAGKVRIGTPANMTAGTYELHFHNDLFAAGANTLVVVLGGASNMAPLAIEIQLTGVDLNDAVRGGMTALPLDLDTKLANTHEVTAARMGALTDLIDGGRLDLLVDAIKAVTDVLPSAAAVKTALEADGSKLDHIWEMTEDDGGVRRLTANALEQAPGGDATAAKQDEIILALAGKATSAALVTAQADLTTLVSRLSAARAGYLDNLSAGAVAKESHLVSMDLVLAAIQGIVAAIEVGSTPPTVEEIDAQLTTTHGEGSWKGST